MKINWIKVLAVMCWILCNLYFVIEARSVIAMGRVYSPDFSLFLFVFTGCAFGLINLVLLVGYFKNPKGIRPFLAITYAILLVAAFSSFIIIISTFDLPTLKDIPEHSDGRLLLLDSTLPCLLILMNAELVALGIFALMVPFKRFYRFLFLPISIVVYYGMIFWMDATYGLQL